MKLARLALLAAGGVAVAAFAGVFQPSGAHSAPGETSTGGITVFGTGSANVTPDRASFSFGTVSQAATANAALTASSQSVARVVAALKKAGVAQADIQTSDVSLSPRMNDSNNEIVGYTASNTVTATIKKLGDAGDVVDAAVTAGANQVYGPETCSRRMRTPSTELRSRRPSPTLGPRRRHWRLRRARRSERSQRSSRAAAPRRCRWQLVLRRIRACRSSRAPRRSRPPSA